MLDWKDKEQVEFMPKFSVRGVRQRWHESYPKYGSKADDAIALFTGVPTMYTRLLQGYETMDSDLQAASASAASKLCLMVTELMIFLQLLKCCACLKLGAV